MYIAFTTFRRVLFVAGLSSFALLFGFTLYGQTEGPKPSVPDHAYQLADQKMEVSKLDWVLLTARVRMMEQILAHESSRPATAVGMSYDREEKRVVVKGFVDPDWIGNAKIDVIKKVLLEQSLNYCVSGLSMAEAEAGEMIAATNIKADCAVHFFTWTTDKAGRIASKDIAIFQGGQLLLK
jgi:hypothetical protein